MIAHVSLFKLKPEVSEEKLEEIMSMTRVYLLRFPAVLVVRISQRTHKQDC